MLQVPMTREQYNSKVAELAGKGIELAGDRGSVDQSGVTVAYEYDGATLTLDVRHKPFLVTTSYCEAKLREWLGV